MKNQYFGDIRDLFKYDLIQEILDEINSLEKRFTFIPLLTKNDSKTRDGNKRDFDKAKAGTKNKELIEFLKPYNEIDPKLRDFTEIGKYFKPKGFKICIYKGQGNDYFNNRIRGDYFKNIPEGFLHKSLVFVDPDNGLEIKKSRAKHLLYSEVKYLYDRMDEDSILMIFQYFPREKHPKYLRKRSNKLKELTEDLPIYISDNEIMFFLLTKNDELKSQLKKIVNRYLRDYPDLCKGSAILTPSVATS
ncbi:MAG TPA: hypothetical protein C5S37_03820 [Methanophagales archaeon]|nr:hypothetical protein [Methanophagales archaeon]